MKPAPYLPYPVTAGTRSGSHFLDAIVRNVLRPSLSVGGGDGVEPEQRSRSLTVGEDE